MAPPRIAIFQFTMRITRWAGLWAQDRVTWARYGSTSAKSAGMGPTPDLVWAQLLFASPLRCGACDFGACITIYNLLHKKPLLSK